MKKIILFLFFLLVVSFIVIGVFVVFDLFKDELILEYVDKKIVFFGDLIMVGVGVILFKDKYIEIVVDELGFGSMVNMGKLGIILVVRLGRIDLIVECVVLVFVDVDYVIVYGGINDWINNVLIVDVISVLSMIKLILEINIDVIIIFLILFKFFW